MSPSDHEARAEMLLNILRTFPPGDAVLILEMLCAMTLIEASRANITETTKIFCAGIISEIQRRVR